MSLTVTESQAVCDLLRWLADKPRHDGSRYPEARAVEAMELLARHAGRTLQVGPDAKVPALIVERLQAADSDGAAQAVCRAIEAVRRSDGRPLAHSVVAAAFEEWRRRQDAALGERLRVKTAAVVGDPAWGEVDV